MLGSESLSVRLGGIYALQRLAEEYPEEYHVQIMRLFCGFARHPTRDEIHERAVQSEPGVSRTRDDVKAILQAIGIRGEARIALEPKGEYWLDLENAYLMYVDLQGSNLAGANLRNADLSYSFLWDANLRDVFALKTIFRNAKLDRAIFCNAFLIEADMSRATLIDARLEGVHLHMSKLENAILSGANLSGVIGLTQTRLDQARADPKNPPTLEGTLEAETGKQLEWKGKPSKTKPSPPKTHPHPAHKPPGPAPCSDSPGSDHTSGASSPAPRARSRKALPPTPGRRSSETGTGDYVSLP